MELTVVNISGKVRTAKFDGRDFLVVPMTMMVPGVLNGSRGPLLYPEDEAAKSATAWNWIPIVVNHPMTGSARTPDYMSTNGVGHLTNCEFKDGKLKAEGWFDITKTDKVDNRLIPLMRAGKKVELSTGLGVDLETAEGVHNDRTYVAVARSYRPDHLAILPDDVGACSLQDGCGINNAKGDQLLASNAGGVWRTIRGAKVYIEDGKITKGPAALRGMSESEAKKPPSQERTLKRLKAKRDELALKQVQKDQDEQQTQLKIKKGQEAQALRELEASMDKDQSRLKGKSKAGGAKSVSKAVARLKSPGMHITTDTQAEGQASVLWDNMEAARKDFKSRKEFVSEVMKAWKSGQANNKSFPLNHMEIPMCKQSLIDQLVENSDGLWSELDREHLDAFPEERLEQLVDNMCGDASHDDTDEEDEPAKGKAKMTNNKEVTVVPQPRQPITLDDLPAEFRAVYNHGLQAMNREKDNLIDKLVANISDEDAKKAKIETLSKKTMCELKEIASLLPVSNSQQEDHFWKEPEYNYQGAAVGNVRNEAYKPEPLGLPEMDFTA